MTNQTSFLSATPPLARDRSQVFTPIDAAMALWDRFLGDLPTRSRVVEPTCGTGNLLQAIPRGMDVLAIERDPMVAEVARPLITRRGWSLFIGPFEKADLPWAQADAIFGNPPWQKPVIDRLLDWSYERLREEGRCALLLPASYTQYACNAAQLADRWAIESVEIPRDVFFPLDLEEHVTFKVFRKSAVRTVVGMFLYVETAARRSLAARYQRVLREHHWTWRQVVRLALQSLGGSAKLRDIYAEVTSLRYGERSIPDRWQNTHWQEKIRQQLQIHPEFESLGDGRWALAA
jgi:hypothetical protein